MYTRTELQQFDEKLRELTKESYLARPFLCYGLPMDCTIFLVGINPGKTAPFWPRWNAFNGCDKRGWLEDYIAEHGRYSPTRKRIEILFNTLEPLRCLETNIFAIPSSRESHLASSDRDSRVFDFLLETVCPRLIFVHGNSAAEYLRKKFGIHIPRDNFATVRFRGVAIDVIAGHHLSYQWSYAKVEALGRSLAERHRACNNKDRWHIKG